MTKGHHLADGTQVTLYHLCREEPMWAANRIRELSTKSDDAEDRADRLGLRVKSLWADRERLRDSLQDAVEDTNANHRNRWLDDARDLLRTASG